MSNFLGSVQNWGESFGLLKATSCTSGLGNHGSIISVVGKITVEIMELFECTQKVP